LLNIVVLRVSVIPALRPLAMNTFVFLQIVTVSLALICVALVPVVIRQDLGLARRVVQMDALRLARWPTLLTRVGAACLVASFALLVLGCYYILADAPY
jgi:hypothetical protein